MNPAPCGSGQTQRRRRPARQSQHLHRTWGHAGFSALALCLALAIALPGCKSMLPSGVTTSPLPWSNYDEAHAAVDRITPYQTTRAELRAIGIDPAVNPSITILSYTDLRQRLTGMAAVDPTRRERGISDCLDTGKRCTAYWIDVRQVRTKRVGNFWLDMLNFRRDEVTTGWSFTALVVFIDDLAVYALAGGQPNVNSEQITRNPLGPLQGIGQSLRPTVP
jgi:hypothetical protein